MQRKSLIQVTFSIMLALFLLITTVTISPKVASAQYTSNTALEALEEGIEFYEQGDLARAESSYQEAIDKVLANQEIDVLIAAKQRLAKIKENRGNIEESNELKKEAEAGINALGQILNTNKICGEICPSDLSCNGERCERSGAGSLVRCRQCSPGI